MTKEQLLRWCLEKIARYREKYTPEERWDRMVAQGVIDKDGKVLLCPDEEDSEGSNGQAKKDQKETDTPS